MPQKWSGIDWQALKLPASNTGDAENLARARYLWSRRARTPNNWFSDHLTESQRIRGAVYLATRVLGDSAAMSRVSVWKRQEGTKVDTQEADSHEPLPWEHPLSRLVRHPNRHESWGMLLRRHVQQVATTGTALAWRIDNDYHPVELWSVPTASYMPVPVTDRYPEGGYRIQPWFPGPLAMLPGVTNTGGVVVPSEQMVAVRLPHPLVDNEGFAPMTACGLQLDAIESIDRSRATRLRKGARLSATVELEAGVSNPTGPEAERAEEEIRQLIAGPDKDGEVAILPPGATLELHDLSGVEVGWLESWEQLLGFSLAVFGVNKGIAHLSEDSSFAELYARLKAFALLTMAPLLQLIADCYTIQMIHPFWGEEYGLTLEPQRVTMEDEQDRVFKRRSQFRIWTVAEARAFENLPPIEEEWAQERVGEQPKQEQQPEAGPGQEDGKPEVAPDGATAAPQRARPRNAAGRGALGPREMLRGIVGGRGQSNGNGHH